MKIARHASQLIEGVGEVFDACGLQVGDLALAFDAALGDEGDGAGRLFVHNLESKTLFRICDRKYHLNCRRAETFLLLMF